MIKVYLDWNVMSGMKNKHFEELVTIVNNKQKFLLLYSTSHIADISSSQKTMSLEEDELIKNDLEYITSLTNDWCLYNTSKNIMLSQYDPKDIFRQTKDDADLLKDFSLDKILENIDEDTPYADSIKELVDNLKSTPLDPIFEQTFKDPNSSDALNQFLPNLKDDLTFGGLIKSFGELYQNLNETEKYSDLRKLVQNVGINSSHYNETKNPFTLIENTYKRHGIENFSINNYNNNTENAPKWYNDITNEYIMLDLHGFKADKIKVNAKEKNTFKNTTEDASHTAFASLCDFYITNDDKNYNKTKEVYKKLNINTKVLKPQEFVIYYHQYLDTHGFEDHIKNVVQNINPSKEYTETYFDDGTLFGILHVSNCFFLNYFNKIIIPKDKESYGEFMLLKEPSSGTFITNDIEIGTLIEEFITLLGNDVNDKAHFTPEEFSSIETNSITRSWDSNIGNFHLIYTNHKFRLSFYKKNSTK